MEWDSVDTTDIHVDQEEPERKASPVGQEAPIAPEKEPVKEVFKKDIIPDIKLPEIKEEQNEKNKLLIRKDINE
jgi:hypothetical protein